MNFPLALPCRYTDFGLAKHIAQNAFEGYIRAKQQLVETKLAADFDRVRG